MRIEIDTASELMIIDGAKIGFGALELLTKPRAEFVYQFRRNGDEVEGKQWRADDVRFPKGQEPFRE